MGVRLADKGSGKEIRLSPFVKRLEMVIARNFIQKAFYVRDL